MAQMLRYKQLTSMFSSVAKLLYKSWLVRFMRSESRTFTMASFMMTIKFMGLAVIKIGNERRLNKPLNSDQMAFLMALGIKPHTLIKTQPG